MSHPQEPESATRPDAADDAVDPAGHVETGDSETGDSETGDSETGGVGSGASGGESAGESFLDVLGGVMFPGDHLLPSTTLTRIAETYDYTLRARGATPKSVLWHSGFSQWRRHRQLLSILTAQERRTPGLVINDLGCGYGALFQMIRRKRFLRDGLYFGYDLCPAMVRAARRGTTDPRATFIESDQATQQADFSFCSGTFGLRMDTPNDVWRLYVQKALIGLAEQSRRGLAFNMLDCRGDDCRETLYYADPEDYLDFCRKELSPNCTLLDRYYKKIDFTIHVRL